MTWRKTLVLLIAVVTISCLSPLDLRADGLVRDGVGPISTGRGGTNQGFADNAAIILDNPGAMVNVDGNGLGEFGADTVISQVHYGDPLNDVHSHIRPMPMPVLGYIRKSDDGRLALGIGAFAPAGFGAAYGFLNQATPFGSTEFRSIGGLAKILPGLSYKVNDRLSVGLTVGIAFSDAEFDGTYFVQTGPLAGVPARFDLQGFGVAPTGSVGMQYQLFDDTTIGACYTEQTNFDMHGGLHADLFPGFPVTSDFTSKFRLKWPRSVAFGIKHDLCPHRRIAADVIWYDWAHAFDQLNFTLTNPSFGLLPPTINDTLPMRWQNSVSLRLGYEWQPTPLNTYRAGYVYHGSPVPDSTLNPFLDGVLTHAWSLGYSRKLNRAILNLAYQYNLGKQRHVDTSALVGGDFNNSSLNAQAHFAMLSFLVPF